LKPSTGNAARGLASVRPAWWWALGLTALAALLAYVALNWYVIVDDEQWVGMQGEARRNPYLAMQRTLEEMGASIEVVKGNSGWDTALTRAKNEMPKNATLIVGDRRLVRMTPERVAQIREWVRAGGNLIIEAEQVKFDDPLLASYGIGHAGLRWTQKNGYVEKREKNSPADTDEPEEDSFGFDADNLPGDDEMKPGKSQNVFKLKPKIEPSIITFADNNSFQINFRPYQNLRVKKAPDDAQIFDDKVGTRVVQFRDGLGRVTAMSNFDFMTWRAMGQYDHAEFLWHVVATQHPATNAALSASADRKSPKPVVMLALKDQTSGLWAWLGEHAWMVLLAFAALLLAWLARIVRRFGPLNVSASHTRASLGEHLRALGRYAARQHAWGSLAHAARERFLKRLYRERPGLSRADKTMLFLTLEKLTGIGVARIEQAMLGSANDKATFFNTVRSLKAMEAALDHHRQSGINSARGARKK
jgi:hypothetical protein